ncbi:MAG: hypothetical protein GF405_05065 [Candidatus Eisenbacteria bacterium]|nr:hypothetical protein [Candidatus Eisenbacteria bacterium]
MTKRMLLSMALVVMLGTLFLAGCAQEEEVDVEPEAEVIAEFPIDGSRAAADTVNAVIFDPVDSADNNGAFKMIAEEPITVTLFELGDVDIENAQVNYKAMIKTEDIEGQVYLEMISVFGEHEYFSRALDSQVHGSVDWTEQQTPFYLKEGENPTNIKLNLVIYGTGTAWIDDITVTKQPLPEEKE